jgi:Zn-finger nucleic acid-binding protein
MPLVYCPSNSVVSILTSQRRTDVSWRESERGGGIFLEAGGKLRKILQRVQTSLRSDLETDNETTSVARQQILNNATVGLQQ